MSFLLTRPLRDVTQCILESGYCRTISTHTPLAGRDNMRHFFVQGPIGFLLTRPLRDVTKKKTKHKPLWQFLLTRPLRDVTLDIHHLLHE